MAYSADFEPPVGAIRFAIAPYGLTFGTHPHAPH
jgi:hypothetical protein